MIRIRSASAEDEPVIKEIILRSMLASYADFLPAHAFQEKILDADRPGVVARENAPHFHIAEAEGAPAGVILLKDTYVDHLWVHPDFMGRGIGSRLLKHAEKLARAADLDRLTLDCFVKNERAMAFYRARGFTVDDTYEAKHYMPGEYVCFMVKPLS